MTNFPLITAALHEKRTPGFLAAVETIKDAHAAGTIPNAVFIDAKAVISHRFEEVFKAALVKALSLDHVDRDQAELDIYYMAPALHRIGKQIVTVEKSKTDKPMKTVALSLLREIEPVAAMLVDLKNKVTKRAVRSEEERKPSYTPPRSASASVKLVVELLEGVVASSYEQLVQSFMEREEAALSRYAQAQSEAIKDDKELTPHAFFLRTKKDGYIDLAGYNAVEALTETSRAGKIRLTIERTDKKAILRARAVKEADEIKMHFLSKNTRKLVSIVEAKNNLKSAKTVGCEVSLGGMTGTLLLEFEDGASFYAVNSVVYAVSTRGTLFYRTPLTFHDVKLAGGVKMPRPSEQRMNEVFVHLVDAS